MCLKDKLSEKIVEITGITILIILGIKNISDYNMIHVCGDEFGYWANAAYWRGNDWHSLMENTPYYSYGYSALLFLITLLPFSMSVIYRIAIIANVIMLIAIYRLSAYAIRLWFPETGCRQSDFMALTMTLYPSFMTYTQLTLCETPIVFLYWLVLISIIKFEKSGKAYYGVISIILSAAMYMVHQRNLGILCVSILIVCFILFRKFELYKLILFLGIAALLLGMAAWIKNDFSSMQWIAHDYASVNDYSGMASKIESTFGSDGIKRVWESSVGKVFYLASSSYLFVFVGTVFGGKIIIHAIRTRLYIERVYSFTWVILSFVFCVGISAIVLSDNGRMDVVIYGRYSECSIGALILLGMIAIYKKEISTKMLFGIMVLYCGSVFVLLGLADSFNGTELVSLTITGIYRIMSGDVDYSNALCKVVLAVNLVVILWYFAAMLKTPKRIGFYIGLASVGCMWILNADYVIKNTILYSQNVYTERILPIAEQIQENENIQNVVYVIEDRAVSQEDYMNTNVDRLQYLLWKIPIERVEISKLDISSYEGETYFVLMKNARVYERFKEIYHPVTIVETASMELFRQ